MKRPWRQHLTAEEAKTLRPIEAEMAKIKKRLRRLAWERHGIQNRATVRARYAADRARELAR